MRALADHPHLRLATLSEVVDEQRAAGIAPVAAAALRAGSWVYGTLSTWMGDADKNRGWDLLCDAKRAFDAAVACGHLDRGSELRPRRAAAGGLRGLRLVLVVRRLQPRRGRARFRRTVPAPAHQPVSLAGA